MKVTKSSVVRSILANQPNLTVKEIALRAGCDISLVHQIRKSKGLAKTKAIKASNHPSVSIVDASNVLKFLVDDVKDLSISFDHRQSKVDVLWFEELFKLDVAELPRAIECIKYLDSHMVDYTSEAN